MKSFVYTCLALLLSFTSLYSQETQMATNPDTNHPIVTIQTTQGSFDVELWPEVAPKAVENFIQHAKEGYYNGVIFHRVIKGFMIQGGDPQGTGRGGKSIWDTPFEDEVSDSVKFDKPGLLAMANAGPKTNGSQFFITTASTPWLNKRHTIFGRVVSGYDIVQKIESTPTGSGDKPVTDQKIVSITLKQ